MRRFDEDCALADGEFGGRDKGVKVWVRVNLGPGIGILVCQLRARGPGLAGWWDVLAWVLLGFALGGGDTYMCVLGGVGVLL